jgi:Uma2 family endonuclease
MATHATTGSGSEVQEAPPVRRRRFTVEEYYKMAETGILHEDDRVELMDGEILELSPIGSRHAACVKRLLAALPQVIGSEAIVSAQDPVRFSDDTEPQPDVALLKPRDDFYAEAHPGPEDVLLLIEVSDTTLDYDRGEKLKLYADNGIPEYWIADLTSNRVDAYSRPVNGEYRNLNRFGPGETVTSNAIPNLSITVDAILGPPASPTA